jgi:CDP-4-dehydro-6-deoxyglucose reductase, E3
LILKEAGMSFLIKFEPSNVELQSDGISSILDTALESGFFPNHSCRRGECGSCAARLVSGDVRYASEVVPNGLKSGHCLTCVAIPVSDVVLDSPEISGKPGGRVVKFGARVISVDRVSHDVTVVRAQAPLDSGFTFESGQYVDVVLRDGSRRSYSMANIPAQDGQIEWHIRAVPGGRFSQHVYQNLKPRDLLRIEGPFGMFVLREAESPLIFLASGTGYAPIASMLRTHGADIARRGAAFYWGGNREGDLYAMEEAMSWAVSTATLKFVPVLSDPRPDWPGRTGLVHQAVLTDYPDLSQFEVYACGNPLMIDAARQAFVIERGLSETSFHSDSFITSRSTQSDTSTSH